MVMGESPSIPATTLRKLKRDHVSEAGLRFLIEKILALQEAAVLIVWLLPDLANRDSHLLAIQLQLLIHGWVWLSKAETFKLARRATGREELYCG